MFHAHSVYNHFLDSRMRWPTPVSLERFARHWHSVITHSDINWKSCLLIYSNPRWLSRNVGIHFTCTLEDFRFAGIRRRQSFSGWKTFDPVVRVVASWLKQCCEIGQLFDVIASGQLNDIWHPLSLGSFGKMLPAPSSTCHGNHLWCRLCSSLQCSIISGKCVGSSQNFYTQKASHVPVTILIVIHSPWLLMSSLPCPVSYWDLFGIGFLSGFVKSW